MAHYWAFLLSFKSVSLLPSPCIVTFTLSLGLSTPVPKQLNLKIFKITIQSCMNTRKIVLNHWCAMSHHWILSVIFHMHQGANIPWDCTKDSSSFFYSPKVPYWRTSERLIWMPPTHQLLHGYTCTTMASPLSKCFWCHCSNLHNGLCGQSTSDI